MMLNTKYFEDLAKTICAKFPKGMQNAREDVEKTVKSTLQNAFAKLDLVTRKEFDAQIKVLNTLRTKVTQLEKQLKDLEAKKAIQPKK